eukprot:TRINITY_DN754_c0_g1_i5.p1 TRINITY_DN754_c0_g1~~TRINITY_DN754_c0_g1_i5.p1  ORF type:complete len:291 (-),score=21.36 TRINITY_DN754_c0_g1_i5:611-1441(-)
MPICFWANASMFGSPDSFENNNAENDVQSRKRDVRSSVTEDECWVVNKQQKTEADNVALIDGFDGQRVQSESSPIGCDQHAMVENVSSQAVIRCEPTPQQPCSVENQQLAAAQQQQAVELQSATPDHVCMMSQEPALSNPSEHSQRDMDCQGEDSVEAGKSKQGKAVCDMKMQKQLGGVVNYLNPPAQEIFQKVQHVFSEPFARIWTILQCFDQFCSTIIVPNRIIGFVWIATIWIIWSGKEIVTVGWSRYQHIGVRLIGIFLEIIRAQLLLTDIQ